MVANELPSILVMLFCIMMSAYFSATGTAFSSLNAIHIKVLADNGNRRAQLAYRLSENYDKLISTILIGNNIVNIAVSSIATLLFVKLYGDIGATLSTVVVTVVVLIFGDWTFDDFCSYFHIADDADSVSLGGWIMERMEKVPAAGESFEYGGLSITVEEISNNRIQKVRVVQLEQPQEEDSEK